VTLREILANLQNFDEDAGLFFNDVDGLSSPAIIFKTQDEDLPQEHEGKRLIMEVWHVREVLDGLQQLIKKQNGSLPSLEQLFERFLVYLRRDA
jgi:hypothetical protein